MKNKIKEVLTGKDSYLVYMELDRIVETPKGYDIDLPTCTEISFKQLQDIYQLFEDEGKEVTIVVNPDLTYEPGCLGQSDYENLNIEIRYKETRS